jgi:hypothetical protein
LDHKTLAIAHDVRFNLGQSATQWIGIWPDGRIWSERRCVICGSRVPRIFNLDRTVLGQTTGTFVQRQPQQQPVANPMFGNFGTNPSQTQTTGYQRNSRTENATTPAQTALGGGTRAFGSTNTSTGTGFGAFQQQTDGVPGTSASGQKPTTGGLGTSVS